MNGTPSLAALLHRDQGGFLDGHDTQFSQLGEQPFSKDCRRLLDTARFAVCRRGLGRTDRADFCPTRQSVRWRRDLFHGGDGVVVSGTGASRWQGSILPIGRSADRHLLPSAGAGRSHRRHRRLLQSESETLHGRFAGAGPRSRWRGRAAGRRNVALERLAREFRTHHSVISRPCLRAGLWRPAGRRVLRS